MIKLIKSIVNENRKLIGFFVEAKDRELEGFSNEKVQKPIPIKVLAEKQFSNNQIVFHSKGFQEKSNFKINDLPMVAMINNSFIDVDNKIALTKKFVENDQPVGFTVQFGDGSSDNFTYPNVIQLSYWFKPDNFVVRTSANRKKFIAGKPGGLKIEELPTVVIGEKPSDTTPKKVKSNAQDKSAVESTGVFNNAVDLMDLYTALSKCDGLVVKLPDEEYKSLTKPSVVVSNEFHSLGVGEYAYPNLVFNDTKVNASTRFRKPGMVNVEFGPGATMPVQTFTFHNKIIFSNAENHIKRFGVAMPKSYEESFTKAFGKSMSVQPITNNLLIQAITSLTGKNDYAFYEVDTNKIDLIAKSKLDNYILTAKQIKETMEELFIPKLIAKYVSPAHGLINELKKVVPVDHQEIAGKQPLALYAGMSPDFRTKITESGINLYTGAFEKMVKPEYAGKAASKEDDTGINIEYKIAGQDLKDWTYKRIAEAGLKGVDLPAVVIGVIQDLDKITDPAAKMKAAYDIHERMEQLVDAIKAKMWFHKSAMFIKGNKSKIHVDDKGSWVHDTGRRTKAKIYNCVETGCEGLMVAVLNSEI